MFLLNTRYTTAHPYAHFQILLSPSDIASIVISELRLGENHQYFISELHPLIKAQNHHLNDLLAITQPSNVSSRPTRPTVLSQPTQTTSTSHSNKSASNVSNQPTRPTKFIVHPQSGTSTISKLSDLEELSNEYKKVQVIYAFARKLFPFSGT